MNSVSCHDKDFWLREVFRADSISSQHTFFVERVSRGACACCRKPLHHVTRLGDTICELSSAFPRESRNHQCTVTVILAVCKKKKVLKFLFLGWNMTLRTRRYTNFTRVSCSWTFFFLNFCLTLKYLAVKGYVVLDFIILRGVSHILPALVIVNEKDKQIETTLTTV